MIDDDLSPQEENVFHLSSEQYEEFLRLLDEPPRDMPKLQRLFERETPFSE